MLSRFAATKLISISRQTFSIFPRRQVFRFHSEKTNNEVKVENICEKKLRSKPLPGQKVSKIALSAASVFGLGSLCYYGLSLSKKRDVNSLDNSLLWTDEVKQRIYDAYWYVGATIGICAASATTVYKVPFLLNLVTKSGFKPIVAIIAIMIGSGMLAESIPYSPGFGLKQLAWIFHAAFIGAIIAPICFVGGPTVARAAWCSAGIFGGLSAIAVCSPSREFLTWTSPLGMLLGVVFTSTITGLFITPTTAVGSTLYFLSLYGGLLLYSGLLIYDTQLILDAAENNSDEDDDPINNSMEIFMDILNIFVKVFEILASQGLGSD